MKVWRIENKEGIGPFRSSSCTDLWDARERHSGPIDWPNCPEIEINHKFAFSKLKTLKYVIGEENIKDLTKKNFKIVRLNVKQIFRGPQDQVVFVDERKFE